MDALIAKDRAGWETRARALHDVTAEVLKAIDAKDADKVFELGERVEGACETCHKHYWYPNDEAGRAPGPALQMNPIARPITPTPDHSTREAMAVTLPTMDEALASSPIATR
jgi:hypothetical protein